MISRLHISFPLILFILLILLTFWLDQVTRPPERSKDDDLYRTPDYIVENLSGIRMDYERTIQRKFAAEKLFHYLNEEVTQMEQISFISIGAEKPPLRLQADRAEIRNKGKNIYLTEKVTVFRGAEDDRGKITLTTHSLHLMPDENLVKTDQAVAISKLNTMINAIGMELNNHTGVIQLWTRVKVINDK